MARQRRQVGRLWADLGCCFMDAPGLLIYWSSTPSPPPLGDDDLRDVEAWRETYVLGILLAVLFWGWGLGFCFFRFLSGALCGRGFVCPYPPPARR
jgi:hypothetical protein